MNFIEKIVEKYGGHYSEDLIKKFNSPRGKFTYQPLKGLIIVDGSKISINYNESGGAMPANDPVRIILYLKKDYEKKLSIYPGIYLNYLTDLIFQPKNLKIPKDISRQFSFRGNKELIKKLASDSVFCNSILNENIYISILKKTPKKLVITPAFGIENMAHFDKLVFILKQIEKNLTSKI